MPRFEFIRRCHVVVQVRGRVVDILYLLGGQLEVSRSTSWLPRRLPLRCLQHIRPFGRRSRPQSSCCGPELLSLRALQPERSQEVPTRRRDGGYPRLADAARIGRRLHLTNAAFGGRSPPTTGTPSPSRAPAPRRRSADLESIDPGQAREHGMRTVSTNSGKGSPPTLLGDTLPVGGMPLVSRTCTYVHRRRTPRRSPGSSRCQSSSRTPGSRCPRGTSGSRGVSLRNRT